jgi:hypothetical protein
MIGDDDEQLDQGEAASTSHEGHNCHGASFREAGNIEMTRDVY